MTPYARVSVNVPSIMGCFDYHIPVELQPYIQEGCLLEVPFGKQKVQGVVIQLHNTPEVEDMRDVSVLLDPLPVVTPAQIKLAQSLAKTFLCTISQALDLMVPSGLSQRVDQLVSFIGEPGDSLPGQFENRLLSLIREKKSIRGRQLDAAFPRMDWKKPLVKLKQLGWVESTSFLPAPTVQPKMVRTVALAASKTDLEAYTQSTSGKKLTTAAVRRQRVLDFLVMEPGPIPVQWVYAQAACVMADLQHLAGEDLVQLGETEWMRDPVEKITPEVEKTLILTQEQEEALQAIRSGFNQWRNGEAPAPILMQGVTGSGKTEVYLQAAEEVVSQGRQVIILVPEISLTPQTVRRFINHFPGRVGLQHSGLSQGERYDTWRRARASKLDLVVGPRSALFMPFRDVGLIVVDECHDDSYCQGDFGPYYDTRVLAKQYAVISRATCILGSATPDVAQRFNAQREGWKVLSLPYRVQPAVGLQAAKPARPAPGSLPGVRVVDMRAELRNGNRSILSLELQQALMDTVREKHQAILYLNRRGRATYVFCRSCGHTLTCPRCDLPLASHGEQQNLICHQCGYTRGLPQKCPHCNSTAIRQLGVGTETVEAEVRRLLPEANILRWDAETARFKGSHEIILAHFANHRADILVGTQMISKGLDLPLVTLVGVVLAETGLALPDYRAGERTFQHLTQVAGRAGRSDLGGRVIFQTFQPENFIIGQAASHDYTGFYNLELENRRKLGYPPFVQLVRLEFTDISTARAESTAEKTRMRITAWLEASGRTATDVIGPVPCFYGKVNNQYRWQIILRGPDPVSLLNEHIHELTAMRMEVDPPNLL